MKELKDILKPPFTSLESLVLNGDKYQDIICSVYNNVLRCDCISTEDCNCPELDAIATWIAEALNEKTEREWGERKRQNEKWGEQNHPMLGSSYDLQLARENEAYYKKLNKLAIDKSWMSILLEEVYEAFAETDPVKQREEMVQVCAVAVQIVEYLDRSYFGGVEEDDGIENYHCPNCNSFLSFHEDWSIRDEIDGESCVVCPVCRQTKMDRQIKGGKDGT